MKLFGLVAAALLASATSTSAQISEQFDLICAGKASRLAPPAPKTTTPWRGVLHVDLGRSLWCSDECLETRRIEKVSPDALILEFSQAEGESLEVGVSRSTGHYTEIRKVTGPQSVLDTIFADCEVAKLSRVPKLHF